ncbi:MAG: BrnT family toxin [Desulfovibrio sp.]|nr:BrnT family toxin [Desulfovibrio sp.]
MVQFSDDFCLRFKNGFYDAENRHIAIGRTNSGQLLTVVHCYRLHDDGNIKTRIISARRSTPKEKRDYEKHYSSLT